MNEIITKQTLIDEIKKIISTNEKKLEFNPKYIEYFELDELLEIKNKLQHKKEENNTPSKDYLDEIFNSCS